MVGFHTFIPKRSFPHVQWQEPNRQAATPKLLCLNIITSVEMYGESGNWSLSCSLFASFWKMLQIHVISLWGPNFSRGQGWKNSCLNCCLNMREIVLLSCLTGLFFLNNSTFLHILLHLFCNCPFFPFALYTSSLFIPFISPLNARERLYIAWVYLNTETRFHTNSCAMICICRNWINWCIWELILSTMHHTQCPAFIAHPCLSFQCQCYCWWHLSVYLWWTDKLIKLLFYLRFSQNQHSL